MIKKHTIDHFEVSQDEIFAYDDVEKSLKILKEQGMILCLIINTNFPILELMILRQLGISEYISDFLFYSGTPNNKLLEPTIQKYEQEGIARFEMAVVSSDVERDLILANECGLRTVFFSQKATPENYQAMSLLKPEFDAFCHLQL